MRMCTFVVFGALCLAGLGSSGAWGQDAAEKPKAFGHSAHGEAFDQGPRTRPWKMDDIGTSHFPITTSVPEVQEWFDQGHTLLHSFWEYEAERAFRWCLKLDPECAMAYWGLARCGEQWGFDERRETFLREAVKRMDKVTKREQMYIEAFAKAYLPEFAEDLSGGPDNPMAVFEQLAEDLELITLAYPDDVEAKALLVLATFYSNVRAGTEAIIEDILEVEPLHPGAHHYRVHTWDGREGAVALESCEIYGKLASGSGHANHMPGHIYSGIGLWHEGAIWMDSATRVEKAYMQKRMTLPYHNWNYAHNRNYLSFIQEQLGMPTLAIDGAKQLLRAPLDPKYNEEDGYSVYAQGLHSLARTLVKYERWDDILDGAIPWSESEPSQVVQAYCEALAHLAKGDLTEAFDRYPRMAEAAGRGAGGGDNPWERISPARLMADELEGRLELARGNTLKGIELLSRAAKLQHENYREMNDPPSHPHLIYNILGEIHLERHSPGMAAECFAASLEVCPNDGFALSGLTRARHAMGDSPGAADAYGRLLAVWSDAEPGLRWLESVENLGINSQPIHDGPRKQRSYAATTLDHLGPQQWQPYSAPVLDAVDADSKRVTLADYHGQNVLIVFYLGEACVHCVEQLDAIAKRASEFSDRNVALLAISSDSVAKNANTPGLHELPFRLLSDDAQHSNARRFHSYDDFEDLELHSTILIDDQGRIRWARSGGDPFMDLDFLLKEIDRVNKDEDLMEITPATRASK